MQLYYGFYGSKMMPDHKGKDISNARNNMKMPVPIDRKLVSF